MIEPCFLTLKLACFLIWLHFLPYSAAHIIGGLSKAIDFDKNELNFGSVDDFNKFIQTFKTKTIDQLRLDKTLESYVNDRDAILDLEKVISSEEVCAAYKIDELINYHKIYLDPKRFKKQPITYKFFKKYAVQVAYICKKNLIHNLNKAREELREKGRVFEEAKNKVLLEEPSLKSNLKLLQEQPNDPVSTNVKPKNQLELSLDEYREALTKLTRPEDILTFDPDDCKESKNRYTRVSVDKLQTFFKPALMCHQLHRYYAGNILSIAKLANFGYVATDNDLDSVLIQEPMLRDWLMAAQVCDPMLHLCAKEIHGDSAIVDTCAPNVPIIELMVYNDSMEQKFDEKQLEEMVSKSVATRSAAQKLMKAAFKTMAKADVMKQLQSGAGIRGIFKKSLSMFATRQSSKEDLLQNDDSATYRRSPTNLSIQLSGSETSFPSMKSGDEPIIDRQMSDEDSYQVLMKALSLDTAEKGIGEQRNSIDSAVSFFDPMSTLVSFFTVMAIMLSFEWLFFIVMTLAARICHHMYFNFDNLLTFPPKILSWSDADFARLNDEIERVDEDDFYDYSELTPSEREQRDLLQRVFGKPPPMLYRD